MIWQLVAFVFSKTILTYHCTTDMNVPTPVQSAVVPKILGKENIVMAACTGSGKTLAYTLPMVQNLAEQEKNGGQYSFAINLQCILSYGA